MKRERKKGRKEERKKNDKKIPLLFAFVSQVSDPQAY